MKSQSSHEWISVYFAPVSRLSCSLDIASSHEFECGIVNEAVRGGGAQNGEAGVPTAQPRHSLL
jgi:hypothetical protein